MFLETLYGIGEIIHFKISFTNRNDHKINPLNLIGAGPERQREAKTNQ